MQINLPKMYGWQQKVFNNLVKHWSNSIHLIKSRRQCGKSILCELILMYVALSRKGSKAYMLAKSFPQADKVLEEIKNMMQDQKSVYKGCNNISRRIYFKNGSEIRIFSAEQGENLRGYTSNILIIDEACYIDEAVIDLVLPYVNVSRGPVLMASTPKAKAGTFYNYFMMGMANQSNIYAYDWALEDVSELLSNEMLERYRMTMDPLRFKTDYLGQFLDNESAFFGNYDKCVKQVKPVWNNQPVVFGIDWAGSTGGDYTAISVMGMDKTLYDLIYFNDKDPNQTMEAVVQAAKKYKPLRISVETNSIGNVYYGLLKEKLMKIGIPIIGFNTNNDSKDKIISNLQNAFQNNLVAIYSEPELLTEISMYEMTFSKTGKRVFNAKSGFHDDLVMSLAIALNSISSGVYTIL